MKLMKSFRLTIEIIIISLLFVNCAASYKNIHPNKINYGSKIITDSVEIGYTYDAMERARNSKFVKKAKKKNLNILAFEIKNKSKQPIFFEKDIHLGTLDGEIIPINQKEVLQTLNQNVVTHLIWMFGAQYTKYSNGQSELTVGFNPFGAVFAIPNMIVAARANKLLREEFTTYSYEGLSIEPNETKYGIISFYGEKYLDVHLEQFRQKKILKSDVTYKAAFTFNERAIYFDNSYKSIEEYCNSLEKYLSKDSQFRDIEIKKDIFYNGKLKSIGVLSIHKDTFGSYQNKIGTWHFYHENGNLKELIDYNYKQEYHGRMIKYDRDGMITKEDKYINNKRLK